MLLSASLVCAETVERRIDVNPSGQVEVVNVAGSVRVTGWDRAEVQVHGNLGHGVERLDVLRDGDHTLVKVVLPSGFLHWNSGSSDLEINVPRSSNLTTNTVSAEQSIHDVHGVQRLQSVSGDIETEVWNGEFQAKSVSGHVLAKGQENKDKNSIGNVRVSTVSGNLRLANFGNELDLSTVSGAIDVQAQQLTRARMRTTSGNLQLTASMTGAASNELELRTVSGAIDVTAQQLARARISSTSGDLHLTASMIGDATIEAETISGELTYEFNGTVNAEFDIATFSGDIDNCFGPKPKKTHEHGPGMQLRFKEGDGSARIRAKTLSGDVNICRK
jgi:DUF4097 and DUF4098 domain-containing protein YvlB